MLLLLLASLLLMAPPRRRFCCYWRPAVAGIPPFAGYPAVVVEHPSFPHFPDDAAVPTVAGVN
jgi:hypothetical protein